MSYGAKILADSISPAGHRLTTFEVTFPRIVLAEFNTHRLFSRNSASSRAIPVEKMLDRVRNHPFVPAVWGRNKRGMQASDEVLTGADLERAIGLWRDHADDARDAAYVLAGKREEGCLDVHKQIANRLLEPWLWHTVIVSATEWGNFFNLRDNKMAQPEIHRAADLMHQLFKTSAPKSLGYGRWHLPLVTEDEMASDAELVAPWSEMAEAAWYDGWVKVSAGRCARVSYLTHDGTRNPAEDVRLHDSLLASGHMSPLEHPARPMTAHELKVFQAPELIFREADQTWVHTGRFTYFLGNFNGWVQHRKMIPGEADIHTHRSK